MTPDDLTCTQCREHLPWYVTGTSSEGEWSAVERHLAGCADCRREAETWGTIATMLGDEESRIPPDTHAGDAWFALRNHLSARTVSPERGSETRQGHLVDPSTNFRGPLSIPAVVVAPPQARHPARRRALVATALLVVLSVALFGFFGEQLRHAKAPAVAASSTSTPAGCAAGTLDATIPPNTILQDISMTSPRDGWAVGWIEIITPQDSVVVKGAVLLHLQNCHWQRVDATSIPAAELVSVSMSSATDGWAVGSTADNKLLVLHYAGGDWQQVQLPGITYGFVDGFGTVVRMVSSTEGWMLIDGGKTHTDPYTSKYAYTLLHFRGSAWVPVPLTFDPAGALIFTDIAATTPDDCWIVGYSTGNVSGSDDFGVAHYHDGAWTTWTDSQLGISYPIFYSITMASPADVWISGDYGENGSTSLLLRYDGSQWRREQIAGLPEQDGISTIAAISPTELWAFSSTAQSSYTGPPPPVHAIVGHYQNGTWTLDTIPGDIGSVSAVSFLSASEGFAVAQVDSNTYPPLTELLHYVNGVWSVIPSR